eukprot:745956-Hanusia_phi.AAC.2
METCRLTGTKISHSVKVSFLVTPLPSLPLPSLPLPPSPPFSSPHSDSPHSLQDWECALFTSSDRERYINLGPYMNSAPYTVQETCLLDKAFELFQQ